MDISLKPIGQVRNDIRDNKHHSWSEVKSAIHLDPLLTASLDGLEDFSHIVVLFWMHQMEGQAPAKVHPQGRDDMPLVGTFATRSPHRPNGIGMTTVRLLERKGNVLQVTGLDAIDQTPVLDIKPYLSGDDVADARYPEWVFRLHRK